MRLIWAVALCLAVEPAFAQSYTSDQIAGSLGFMMGMASLCARPTASLEAELELYIRKAGAGPLEADRLRGEALRGSADFRPVMTGSPYLHCENADREITDTIAKVRRDTMR
jgi:hypothetical protein